MKTTLLLFITMILSVGLLAVDQPPVQLPVSENGAKIASGTITELAVARLKRIEQIVYPELNRGLSADVRALMTEVYDLLQLLPQDINISVQKPDTTDVTRQRLLEHRRDLNASRFRDRLTPVPARYPMQTAEYEALLAAVEAESFRRNKLTLLRSASATNRFSTDQIIRLLNALDFSADRFQALEALYPECTDPQNNYRILEVFTTIDDKTRAAALMQ